MWETIKEILENTNEFWCEVLFEPIIRSVVDMIFGAEVSISSFLKFNNSDFTYISKIYNYLAVVGVGMLIIYFLINVNKTLVSQGSEFTIHSLFAPFLRFLFGYALVGWGAEIISVILGLNNTLINFIQGDDTGELGDFSDTLANELCDGLDIGQGFIVIFMLIFVLVLQGLANLVVMYHAVSRKIEIIIRVGAAPIALGDAFNGEQSNAYRYLKKLMALIFYGFFMQIIIIVGTQLNIDYIAGLFNGGFEANDIMAFLGLVLYPLAEAGMMSVAKQVTNDAFGV